MGSMAKTAGQVSSQQGRKFCKSILVAQLHLQATQPQPLDRRPAGSPEAPRCADRQIDRQDTTGLD